MKLDLRQLSFSVLFSSEESPKTFPLQKMWNHCWRSMETSAASRSSSPPERPSSLPEMWRCSCPAPSTWTQNSGRSSQVLGHAFRSVVSKYTFVDFEFRDSDAQPPLQRNCQASGSQTIRWNAAQQHSNSVKSDFITWTFNSLAFSSL